MDNKFDFLLQTELLWTYNHFKSAEAIQLDMENNEKKIKVHFNYICTAS